MLVAASQGASPFVSGARVAEELGVSRAAVWKAVQGLQEDGICIASERARGYRLAGVYDELDAAGVRSFLPPSLADRVHLDVKRSTGSTNTDAKAAAENGAGPYSCVIAAEQVEGRGRRGPLFLCDRCRTGGGEGASRTPLLFLGRYGGLSFHCAATDCRGGSIGAYHGRGGCCGVSCDRIPQTRLWRPDKMGQ